MILFTLQIFIFSSQMLHISYKTILSYEKQNNKPLIFLYYKNKKILLLLTQSIYIV